VRVKRAGLAGLSWSDAEAATGKLLGKYLLREPWLTMTEPQSAHDGESAHIDEAALGPNRAFPCENSIRSLWLSRATRAWQFPRQHKPQSVAMLLAQAGLDRQSCSLASSMIGSMLIRSTRPSGYCRNTWMR